MSDPEKILNINFADRPGHLLIFDEKIDWIPNRGNGEISLTAKDIRGLKATPDKKTEQTLIVSMSGTDEEIRLEIDGKDHAIKLEKKKEILLAIKNLVKKRTTSENNNAKARALSTNPRIRSLYKALVESEISTDGEFWNTHVDEQLLTQSQPPQTAFSLPVHSVKKENGKIVFELSSEQIQAILQTDSSLRRKYVIAVEGGKVSHEDFWTDYLKRTVCEEEMGANSIANDEQTPVEKSEASFSQMINQQSIRSLENVKNCECFVSQVYNEPPMKSDYSGSLSHLLPSSDVPLFSPASTDGVKFVVKTSESKGGNPLMEQMESRIAAFEDRGVRKTKVPLPQSNDIYDEVNATTELLRNFWKYFSDTDPAAKQKAIAIGRQLSMYKKLKIDSIKPDKSIDDMVEQLSKMLGAAINRFECLGQ